MSKVPIANWRKANRSTESGTNCVETGWTASLIGYRDSKDLGGVLLVFPHGAARQFLAVVCGVDGRKPHPHI